MLGLPVKEAKQAIERADATVARVDRLVSEVTPLVLDTLRHARGIAEDLHAITSGLRALIARPKSS